MVGTKDQNERGRERNCRRHGGAVKKKKKKKKRPSLTVARNQSRL